MMTSRFRARIAGWVGGTFAALLVSLPSSATASPAEPNILYFGNSFTRFYSFNAWVDNAVNTIHTAAGRTPGKSVAQVIGGATLANFLLPQTSPTVDELAVSPELPAGETWDYLILQGGSEEATVAKGNPAAFRANGKTIFEKILAANPNVKVITYQTWARNTNYIDQYYPGGPAPYYPTLFPDPAAMQAEIRANYRSLVADINAVGGAGRARYAGVGDAVASEAWADLYYKPDWYHGSDRTGLLAALTIYGSMYGPTTARLASTGALDALATSVDLTHADIVQLAALADAHGYRPGDADMDFDVDFNDLLTLAQNYGSAAPQTWFSGDFDANNAVDFADLLALAQRYGSANVVDGGFGETFQADWARARAIVPEPAALAGAVIFTIVCRRDTLRR